MGEIHRGWQDAAMCVFGQDISLSHGPETDNDNALRKINKKNAD